MFGIDKNVSRWMGLGTLLAVCAVVTDNSAAAQETRARALRGAERRDVPERRAHRDGRAESERLTEDARELVAGITEMKPVMTGVKLDKTGKVIAEIDVFAEQGVELDGVEVEEILGSLSVAKGNLRSDKTVLAHEAGTPVPKPKPLFVLALPRRRLALAIRDADTRFGHWEPCDAEGTVVVCYASRGMDDRDVRFFLDRDARGRIISRSLERAEPAPMLRYSIWNGATFELLDEEADVAAEGTIGKFGSHQLLYPKKKEAQLLNEEDSGKPNKGTIGKFGSHQLLYPKEAAAESMGDGGFEVTIELVGAMR